MWHALAEALRLVDESTVCTTDKLRKELATKYSAKLTDSSGSVEVSNRIKFENRLSTRNSYDASSFIHALSEGKRIYGNDADLNQMAEILERCIFVWRYDGSRNSWTLEALAPKYADRAPLLLQCRDTHFEPLTLDEEVTGGVASPKSATFSTTEGRQTASGGSSSSATKLSFPTGKPHSPAPKDSSSATKPRFPTVQPHSPALNDTVSVGSQRKSSSPTRSGVSLFIHHSSSVSSPREAPVQKLPQVLRDIQHEGLEAEEVLMRECERVLGSPYSRVFGVVSSVDSDELPSEPIAYPVSRDWIWETARAVRRLWKVADAGNLADGTPSLRSFLQAQKIHLLDALEARYLAHAFRFLANRVAESKNEHPEVVAELRGEHLEVVVTKTDCESRVRDLLVRSKLIPITDKTVESRDGQVAFTLASAPEELDDLLHMFVVDTLIANIFKSTVDSVPDRSRSGELPHLKILKGLAVSKLAIHGLADDISTISDLRLLPREPSERTDFLVEQGRLARLLQYRAEKSDRTLKTSADMVMAIAPKPKDLDRISWDPSNVHVVDRNSVLEQVFRLKPTDEALGQEELRHLWTSFADVAALTVTSDKSREELTKLRNSHLRQVEDFWLKLSESDTKVRERVFPLVPPPLSCAAFLGRRSG
jgi:hypothetical protein